jgi:Rrf2 family protein
MRLSTRARYALRAMIQIARNDKDDKPVKLNDISSRTSISRRYLEQVVIPLRNANLITGMSGKNGGYRLAKPARDIRVGDIVQAAIGPINVVNCANNPDSCSKAEECECRPLYVMLNKKIVGALNELTLRDLSDREWAKKSDIEE